ncbi:vWA domain-containing protein [Staphylospora marina]|uniref:vWA domain-containing protein n=1 Tax=Staphylospora marina TaxID=2490858 RepID=UPI000F5BEC58|nr:VWA domain-containing protein [Staphylospora marina]
MKWLEPGAGWLALWALPAILILYFLRKKHEPRTVSSTLLWRRVMEREEANRPWQKFRQHLLLWLQLLAAALMILALARPALPADGLAGPHTVVVIDVSGSMLAREGDQTRLEIAKETVKTWIRRADADQTLTLIEAGRTPRVLATECSGRECLAAVEQIGGMAGRADTDGALSLARAIVARDAAARVVLVSDGAGAKKETGHLPDRFHRIGSQGSNLAVGAFIVKGDELRTEAFVRVDNPGNVRMSGALSISDSQGRVLDARTVSLAPGESRTVRLQDLPAADWYKATVSARGDALPEDDSRWSTVSGRETVSVWLTGKENLFLRKALELSTGSQPVEGDRPPVSGGAKVLRVSDGPVGEWPPDLPLLVFDPSPSWGGSLSGGRTVSGKVKADPRHPIVAGLNPGSWHVADVRVTTPPAWARPIVTANGVPLLLAGETGGRRVVWFPFDPAKSDVPLQPEFPLLIHQAIRWLSPLGGGESVLAEAGETVPLSSGDQVRLLRFTGEDPEGEQADTEGRFPERPGLYRMSDAGSGAVLGRASVTFPSGESDIVPKEVPIASAGDHRESVPTHDEWWRWVALAALLVVGAEWVVYVRGG